MAAYQRYIFTITWIDHYFSTVSPFPTVLKALRKVITDQVTGIMTIPVCPSQPWCPVFTQLHMISSHSSDDRNVTECYGCGALVSLVEIIRTSISPSSIKKIYYYKKKKKKTLQEETVKISFMHQFPIF